MLTPPRMAFPAAAIKSDPATAGAPPLRPDPPLAMAALVPVPSVRGTCYRRGEDRQAPRWTKTMARAAGATNDFETPGSLAGVVGDPGAVPELVIGNPIMEDIEERSGGADVSSAKETWSLVDTNRFFELLTLHGRE